MNIITNIPTTCTISRLDPTWGHHLHLGQPTCGIAHDGVVIIQRSFMIINCMNLVWEWRCKCCSGKLAFPRLELPLETLALSLQVIWKTLLHQLIGKSILYVLVHFLTVIYIMLNLSLFMLYCWTFN